MIRIFFSLILMLGVFLILPVYADDELAKQREVILETLKSKDLTQQQREALLDALKFFPKEDGQEKTIKLDEVSDQEKKKAMSALVKEKEEIPVQDDKQQINDHGLDINNEAYISDYQKKARLKWQEKMQKKKEQQELYRQKVEQRSFNVEPESTP